MISDSPAVRLISSGFKRDDNETILCNERVEIKFDGTTLFLAQSWEHGEELAPIFSGACWAGTVVWQAALDLCEFLSKHLRNELRGATVVELGCGIGVPGMIARLLGATVVLTEQDELLSLLGENLTTNFPGDDRIRSAALDWERVDDTNNLLASLRCLQGQASVVGKPLPRQTVVAGDTAESLLGCSENLLNGTTVPPNASDPCLCAPHNDGKHYDEGREESYSQANVSSTATFMSCTSTVADVRTETISAEGEEATGGSMEDMCSNVKEAQERKVHLEPAIQRQVPSRPDFILCADCIFEPLYGESWKALAKVMGRLSDTGTTVLASVERRGEDGVSKFLEACHGEGFTVRMVFRAPMDAPAPVELYELRKRVARESL